MENNNNNKSKLSVITHPEALYETAHELADKAASTTIGQYAIDKIDKVLSTIEKTAKWSLPQSEQQPTNADKTSHSTILDRPLPWIPFLATIMALRAIRISLSFASILIGNEPITASSVVYFLQTRRRKLRYIKFNGLRNIRLRQEQNELNKNYGLLYKLNKLIGFVFCRSGGNQLNNQQQDAHIQIKYKKNDKSKNNKGRKKHKLNSKTKAEIADANVIDTASGENIPIELLKYLHNEGGDDSDDSDFILDDKNSTLEECSSEVTTISDNDEIMDEKTNGAIEKNKKLLEELIQKKHEELENEIKSKIESQIEERIALALYAKLDDKLEKLQHEIHNDIQNNSQNSTLSSPTSHSQQQHEQQEELQENDIKLNNNNNNNNNNEIPENPSSVSINPIKLSPEIAHNGNIDDLKHENTHNEIKDNKERGYKKLTLVITSDSSSSEDIFYSPDIEYEKMFENHLSSVQDAIKQQRDELKSIQSTIPFIENEVKTNLQINLKPTPTTRKNNNSHNIHSSKIKSKK